jgi:hypothetical protein
MSKEIKITVSKFYKPKMWEVLKISSLNKWSIVTKIDESASMGIILTTTPINLSKWGWVRNFQIWMLGKIFQPKKQ